MTIPQHSPASEVDRIADDYFDATVAMSPLTLTALGRAERQDEFDDFSPLGFEADHELRLQTRERLAKARPTSVTDRVTVASLSERLDVDIELHESGRDLLSINGLETPLHAVRECFDVMPTGTVEQWATICRRLRAVPTALFGWTLSQRAAIERGLLPARRQVLLLAEQVEQWIAPGGFLDGFCAGARVGDDALPYELAAELARSVEVARAGFARAASHLREEFLPVSTERDAVGIDTYQMFSRIHLGATVDLAETYAWGLDEVANLRRLEEETAERIRPGATIAEAAALLDADERYLLHGVDELRRWMQERADEAVKALDGKHFDIAEPVRTIECCITPTQDGGIYYSEPSEDFTRPGRMWWSVPAGVEQFSTWRELTTVYHEGVPGHHLQVAQVSLQADTLNRWRRLGSWVAGHGEGWALYAEQLMAELGFQDDPGDYLGMLDGQMLRAVRVVIDIGLHCGDEVCDDPRFAAPESVGGGPWTFDKAWTYFNQNVFMDPASALFEVNRYAGWPGQAPAYKLGQRLWTELREQVAEAKGDDFDLKDFHATALGLGGMGLDVLRAAVLDLEGVAVED